MPPTDSISPEATDATSIPTPGEHAGVTSPFAAESLEVYPTFGKLHALAPEWHVTIRGRVVAPRPDNLRRRLVMDVVRRLLKASPEQLASATFRERMHGFLLLTRSRRSVTIEASGSSFRLERRSKRSGHFAGILKVPLSDVTSLDLDNPENPWMRFQLHSKRSLEKVEGRAQLILPHGPSVISDIDDTIKCSHVANRRHLLASTFFLPFRDVSGMAARYQQWSQRGAAIHYVSSSPWQLYCPLARFLAQSGFPDGSFHLRTIRLRDPSILQLVVGRKQSKKRAIKSILRTFPDRHYILVGDMGERDPEIYGAFARRYPRQIAQVCIRRLPTSSAAEPRLMRAFRDLPRTRWRLFDEAHDLDDLVPVSGKPWKICEA